MCYSSIRIAKLLRLSAGHSAGALAPQGWMLLPRLRCGLLCAISLCCCCCCCRLRRRLSLLRPLLLLVLSVLGAAAPAPVSRVLGSVALHFLEGCLCQIYAARVRQAYQVQQHIRQLFPCAHVGGIMGWCWLVLPCTILTML